jgi:hypothetical protein
VRPNPRLAAGVLRPGVLHAEGYAMALSPPQDLDATLVVGQFTARTFHRAAL